jgi:hypothetical protein
MTSCGLPWLLATYGGSSITHAYHVMALPGGTDRPHGRRATGYHDRPGRACRREEDAVEARR